MCSFKPRHRAQIKVAMKITRNAYITRFGPFGPVLCTPHTLLEVPPLPENSQDRVEEDRDAQLVSNSADAAAYTKVTHNSVLLKKEAYLANTKIHMLSQRLQTSYLEMRVLRDDIAALEDEIGTLQLKANITRAKRGALGQQQKCLEQEADAPNLCAPPLICAQLTH